MGYSLNRGNPSSDPLADMTPFEKCKLTLEENRERVEYFKRRLAEIGMSRLEVVIVIINVDNFYGGPLAEALMPGKDWQAIRDTGAIPYAHGLAGREGIQDMLDTIAPNQAQDLRAIREGIAVVILDHECAGVFEE